MWGGWVRCVCGVGEVCLGWVRCVVWVRCVWCGWCEVCGVGVVWVILCRHY